MTDPGGHPGAKRHAPATSRNRNAITRVLQSVLPNEGSVLEIASGSGEHIVHFAKAFPDLFWQPSDPDATARASIAAWSAEADLPNIRPPLAIDAMSADWPLASTDAILCINMVHISPMAATEGLFAGAAQLLSARAPLYLYGPFRIPGQPTAPSNEAFDRSLRSRNSEWGLRSLDQMEEIARHCGFELEQTVEMPANNLSLVWQRIALD